MNNGIFTSEYSPPPAPLAQGYAPPAMTLPFRRGQNRTRIPVVTVTQSGFGLTSPVVLTSAITSGLGLALPVSDPNVFTTSHGPSNLGTTNPNAWRSVPAGTAGSGAISTMVLTFAVSGAYNVAGFSFWNLGQTTTVADQGISSATIEYQTLSGSWVALSGEGIPSSFNRGPASSTSISAQVITFPAPIATANIRFRNMSNFGGLATSLNNRIGFSEIQFFAMH